MATINFGKVKLVHRGQYDPTVEYSAGDIVSYGSTSGDTGGAFQHSNPTFIYKGKTAKTGSHPYVQTRFGITTLGIHTSIIDLEIESSENPGGDHRSYAVEGLSFVHSEYYPPSTRVIKVEPTNSSTVKLTLSKNSRNGSELSNETIVVGSCRLANRYDLIRNEVDWDCYSDTFTFRGEWDANGTYEPGNIVVRYGQSYICKAATGAGTTFFADLSVPTNGDPAVLGPCTTRTAADPFWDYLDNWDTYMVGDMGCEKQNKISLIPNSNPVDWKGHPFIKPPSWGQNTGLGSYYQGGTPWTGPAGFTTSEHTWRWQRVKRMVSEGGRLWLTNQQGDPMSLGGMSPNLDASFKNVGGNDGDDVGGMLQITDVFNHNSWWEGDQPSAGGLSYGLNYNRFGGSKTKPVPIQWINNPTTRMYLFSNGTVGMTGSNVGVGLFGMGYSTDLTTNSVVEISQQKFNNRKVVKVDAYSSILANASGEGGSFAMALDEFGELWVWGDNAERQLGIGSESGDFGGAGGNEIFNAQNDQYEPLCLNKDDRFSMPRGSGGKRIVDFYINGWSTWALDEDGETWAWGNNTDGQLGYPTNTAVDVNYGGVGFRNQSYAQSPQKHSYMGVLGYDFTTTALTNVVATGTLTENVAGNDYTKASGAGWNAEIRSTNQYIGSVAVQASCVDGGTAMFGLSDDPATNTTYTTINAGWYFNSYYLQYVENGANSNLTRGGASGQYKFTENTVCSVVYDHDTGFFHWYYDFLGDGRCVQLTRRRHKTDVGVAATTTYVYFDSSINAVGTRLFNIGATSTISRKDWSDYGGVQKIAVRSTQDLTNIYILDGQGHVWSCGENSQGQLGDGATSTDDDNTSALQRRIFAEHVNSTARLNTGEPGIGTHLIGRINNIWPTGTQEENLFVSAQDPNDSNNNYIYGLGANAHRILTDNSTTDREYLVPINASSGQGSYAGLNVGIAHTLRNIVNMVQGGSMRGGTSGDTREVTFAQDAAGYAWAGGGDYLGASAAINIETSDNQYIVNNIAYNQQEGGATQSWAKTFMPSQLQGKIIDIEVSGADNSQGTPPAVTRSTQTAMFLFADASALWCGQNHLHTVVVASTTNSYRAPVTLPGFGY